MLTFAVVIFKIRTFLFLSCDFDQAKSYFTTRLALNAFNNEEIISYIILTT